MVGMKLRFNRSQTQNFRKHSEWKRFHERLSLFHIGDNNVGSVRMDRCG